MNQLNRVRIEKKMTVEAFAKEMQFAVCYVARLLYSGELPSSELLKRIKKKWPDVDMNLFFTT